jgi:RecA-family ATPase
MVFAPDEVRGKLFLDAGRDLQMMFAMQTREGVVPNDALVNRMIDKISHHKIGVTFIDPIVSAHAVNENDNMAMGAVVSLIREVADKTNSGIGLVHHIRKGNGEDAGIDSVRGAGSLLGHRARLASLTVYHLMMQSSWGSTRARQRASSGWTMARPISARHRTRRSIAA